jgi:hypothetical protein
VGEERSPINQNDGLFGFEIERLREKKTKKRIKSVRNIILTIY